MADTVYSRASLASADLASENMMRSPKGVGVTVSKPFASPHGHKRAFGAEITNGTPTALLSGSKSSSRPGVARSASGTPASASPAARLSALAPAAAVSAARSPVPRMALNLQSPSATKPRPSARGFLSPLSSPPVSACALKAVCSAPAVHRANSPVAPLCGSSGVPAADTAPATPAAAVAPTTPGSAEQAGSSAAAAQLFSPAASRPLFAPAGDNPCGGAAASECLKPLGAESAPTHDSGADDSACTATTASSGDDDHDDLEDGRSAAEDCDVPVCPSAASASPGAASPAAAAAAAVGAPAVSAEAYFSPWAAPFAPSANAACSAGSAASRARHRAPANTPASASASASASRQGSGAGLRSQWRSQWRSPTLLLLQQQQQAGASISASAMGSSASPLAFSWAGSSLRSGSDGGAAVGNLSPPGTFGSAAAAGMAMTLGAATAPVPAALFAQSAGAEVRFAVAQAGAAAETALALQRAALEAQLRTVLRELDEERSRTGRLASDCAELRGQVRMLLAALASADPAVASSSSSSSGTGAGAGAGAGIARTRRSTSAGATPRVAVPVQRSSPANLRTTQGGSSAGGKSLNKSLRRGAVSFGSPAVAAAMPSPAADMSAATEAFNTTDGSGHPANTRAADAVAAMAIELADAAARAQAAEQELALLRVRAQEQGEHVAALTAALDSARWHAAEEHARSSAALHAAVDALSLARAVVADYEAALAASGSAGQEALTHLQAKHAASAGAFAASTAAPSHVLQHMASALQAVLRGDDDATEHMETEMAPAIAALLPENAYAAAYGVGASKGSAAAAPALASTVQVPHSAAPRTVSARRGGRSASRFAVFSPTFSTPSAFATPASGAGDCHDDAFGGDADFVPGSERSAGCSSVVSDRTAALAAVAAAGMGLMPTDDEDAEAKHGDGGEMAAVGAKTNTQSSAAVPLSAARTGPASTRRAVKFARDSSGSKLNSSSSSRNVSASKLRTPMWRSSASKPFDSAASSGRFSSVASGGGASCMTDASGASAGGASCMTFSSAGAGSSASMTAGSTFASPAGAVFRMTGTGASPAPVAFADVLARTMASVQRTAARSARFARLAGTAPVLTPEQLASASASTSAGARVSADVGFDAVVYAGSPTSALAEEALAALQAALQMPSPTESELSADAHEQAEAEAGVDDDDDVDVEMESAALEGGDGSEVAYSGAGPSARTGANSSASSVMRVVRSLGALLATPPPTAAAIVESACAYAATALPATAHRPRTFSSSSIGSYRGLGLGASPRLSPAEVLRASPAAAAVTDAAISFPAGVDQLGLPTDVQELLAQLQSGMDGLRAVIAAQLQQLPHALQTQTGAAAARHSRSAARARSSSNSGGGVSTPSSAAAAVASAPLLQAAQGHWQVACAALTSLRSRLGELSGDLGLALATTADRTRAVDTLRTAVASAQGEALTQQAAASSLLLQVRALTHALAAAQADADAAAAAQKSTLHASLKLETVSAAVSPVQMPVVASAATSPAQVPAVAFTSAATSPLATSGTSSSSSSNFNSEFGVAAWACANIDEAAVAVSPAAAASPAAAFSTYESSSSAAALATLQRAREVSLAHFSHAWSRANDILAAFALPAAPSTGSGAGARVHIASGRNAGGRISEEGEAGGVSTDSSSQASSVTDISAASAASGEVDAGGDTEPANGGSEADSLPSPRLPATAYDLGVYYDDDAAAVHQGTPAAHALPSPPPSAAAGSAVAAAPPMQLTPTPANADTSGSPAVLPSSLPATAPSSGNVDPRVVEAGAAAEAASGSGDVRARSETATAGLIFCLSPDEEQPHGDDADGELGRSPAAGAPQRLALGDDADGIASREAAHESDAPVDPLSRLSPSPGADGDNSFDGSQSQSVDSIAALEEGAEEPWRMELGLHAASSGEADESLHSLEPEAELTAELVPEAAVNVNEIAAVEAIEVQQLDDVAEFHITAMAARASVAEGTQHSPHDASLAEPVTMTLAERLEAALSNSGGEQQLTNAAAVPAELAPVAGVATSALLPIAALVTPAGRGVSSASSVMATAGRGGAAASALPRAAAAGKASDRARHPANARGAAGLSRTQQIGSRPAAAAGVPMATARYGPRRGAAAAPPPAPAGSGSGSSIAADVIHRRYGYGVHLPSLASTVSGSGSGAAAAAAVVGAASAGAAALSGSAGARTRSLSNNARHYNIRPAVVQPGAKAAKPADAVSAAAAAGTSKPRASTAAAGAAHAGRPRPAAAPATVGAAVTAAVPGARGRTGSGGASAAPAAPAVAAAVLPAAGQGQGQGQGDVILRIPRFGVATATGSSDSSHGAGLASGAMPMSIAPRAGGRAARVRHRQTDGIFSDDDDHDEAIAAAAAATAELAGSTEFLE